MSRPQATVRRVGRRPTAIPNSEFVSGRPGDHFRCTLSTPSAQDFYPRFSETRSSRVMISRLSSKSDTSNPAPAAPTPRPAITRPLIPTPTTKTRATARDNPVIQHGASSPPKLRVISCHSVQPLERPLRRPTDHSNARTTVHTSGRRAQARANRRRQRSGFKAHPKEEPMNPPLAAVLHGARRAPVTHLNQPDGLPAPTIKN